MDEYSKYFTLVREWLVAHGPNLLLALAILVFGRWLVKWGTYFLTSALKRTGLDATLVRFLEKIIYYTLLVAVIIAAADQAGIKTTSFLAIIGAAGLAVGLALKDSLANFASGVLLIIFQPFKVRDMVTVAGVTGTVERIDIFNSVLITPDNQKIILPNSSITSSIIVNINALPTRRIDLVIGISYGDDVRRARALLQQIIENEARILAEPAPVIALGELGASSVDILVRPWVKSEDYWDVRFALLEQIKLTFDEQGITIPFPQQDIHLYKHPAGAQPSP
ncbi:MAG TPA: mechanosensitive ion channel protein MscS [Desulfobulbaceae bacterium]|nr:mechanosensitive ion channel protein MscS [Desulfobulbaceae bacterium]